jgi:curved DNA-binding protein CbpA
VTEPDPFAALGLPPRADLSDDDVRAAWRRIAAATHPDRDDGGDPARFGAAAAAYALLRTAYSRGEALADLGSHAGPRVRAGAPWPGVRGRFVVLALRVVAATGSCAGAFTVAGWAPASIGVLTGALTWLIATGRHDIAPAGRRLASQFRRLPGAERGRFHPVLAGCRAEPARPVP